MSWKLPKTKLTLLTADVCTSNHIVDLRLGKIRKVSLVAISFSYLALPPGFPTKLYELEVAGNKTFQFHFLPDRHAIVDVVTAVRTSKGVMTAHY